MELKTKAFFCEILCCSKRTIFCRTNGFKAFAKLKNSILVAHPNLLNRLNPFEKRRFNFWIQLQACVTKLTNRSFCNLAIVAKLNNIMTVTKSKNWNIKIQNLVVKIRSFFIINRAWSATENNSFGIFKSIELCSRKGNF